MLVVGSLGISQKAYAQTIDVSNIAVDTQQGLIIVGLGIGAGFLVAYQGYRTTKKDWDTLLFFDGVIKAVIGSVPLAIVGAMSQSSFGVVEYTIIFFGAMGISHQIKKSTQKTVPSNQPEG